MTVCSCIIRVLLRQKPTKNGNRGRRIVVDLTWPEHRMAEQQETTRDAKWLRSAFTGTVTADGSSGFAAEAGRYHLYGALNCPFTHRTLIMRSLKGLENAIALTAVDYIKGEHGWKFPKTKTGASADHVNNAEALRDIYMKADPNYQGRITVPVLWDKETNNIVSNDSASIMRMFNSEFNAYCKTEEQRKLDYYPPALRDQIDELNGWIGNCINDGVYSAGLAKSQEAYEKAARSFYTAMDKVEDILSKQRFLTGPTMTESDVRLFCSLIRLDVAYVHLFKLLLKRLVDYPNMLAYTRDIYQTNGIANTVNMEHIVKGYYDSMKHLSPSGIIPLVPEVNVLAPHDREKFNNAV